jgi:4,5-DOPA dioxygenase extradiol
MSTMRSPSTTAVADSRIPGQHPFAGHLRRAAATELASAHRVWRPEDGALPSLYISHGAPMLFEMTDWMTQLHSWARALPKPKAILIVSAHWESAPLSMSSSRPTELVYDFGGFDPMYFTMRYDTPAATELAEQSPNSCRTVNRSTNTGPAAWTTAPGCL